MITLKAKYKDGQVTFIDPVPFRGQHDVLVTFFTSDNKMIIIPEEVSKELKTYIREGNILTNKEFEVLRIAREGYKINEIAEKQGISNGSIRNYLSSIYSKLKVSNRPEAIKKAIQLGLLDPVDEVNNPSQELKDNIRESYAITKTELEVIRLAQEGYKTREIAKKLELGEGSTRNYLSSIYSKLKVRNRPEAIKKAIQLGLLDPTRGI